MYDFFFFFLLFTFTTLYFLRKPPGRRRCVVVVLGDLGRSPRMQYHALSLLQRGYAVDLVGYSESPLIPELACFKTLKIVELRQPITCPNRFYYVVKVLHQTFFLSLALFFRCHKAHFILMQNPPCIPSMAVCSFFRFIWGCYLIYDWHNYAYTILSLSLGSLSTLFRISKYYEQFFSTSSDYNLCVSKAMQSDLCNNWPSPIHSITLYDKAPSRFKELKFAEKKEFLKTQTFLDQKYVEKLLAPKDAEKWVLAVSSTSWTLDEDFQILLDALISYDTKCKKFGEGSDGKPVKIVCAITGKGPMKDYYCTKVKEMNLENVLICTPWLESGDYPKLIGCADFGICLHTSSSGLDLPMKIVDMFGCNLPVCAVNYNCIDELVKNEQTGLLFKSSSQLCEHILRLTKDAYQSNSLLNGMRRNLREINGHRWDEEWESKLWPIIKNFD